MSPAPLPPEVRAAIREAVAAEAAAFLEALEHRLTPAITIRLAGVVERFEAHVAKMFRLDRFEDDDDGEAWKRGAD